MPWGKVKQHSIFIFFLNTNRQQFSKHVWFHLQQYLLIFILVHQNFDLHSEAKLKILFRSIVFSNLPGCELHSEIKLIFRSCPYFLILSKKLATLSVAALLVEILNKIFLSILSSNGFVFFIESITLLRLFGLCKFDISAKNVKCLLFWTNQYFP